MNDLKVIDQALVQVEKFTKKVLSIPPKDSEILINKFANNSKYLPVSFVENQLDEIFFGAWETTDFRTQVIANEIVGTLQLRFFHPILKIWISRTGAAAVQIQLTSIENGGSGDITNVKDKIKNTLTKDFPHLKAECIKNAARSIGKIFGRDLNRKETDTYNPLTETMANQELITDIEKKLKNCLNSEELGMLWETLDEEQQNISSIKNLFVTKKNQLRYAKK